MGVLSVALARATIGLASRWTLGPGTTFAQQRARTDLLFRLPGAPRGWRAERSAFAGVPCDVLTPPGHPGDGVTLLYLHGGGYVVGSAGAYRGLAGRLGAALGARVVIPDYRLAPEHPAPAALGDSRGVYAAVLAKGAARVVVAGDSAGGGLALALAMALRDAGRPAPAALGLICPWVDVRPELTGTRPPAPREPLLNRRITRAWAQAYVSGGAAADDPRVSPLLGDLRGLPPIVVHSCADDLIAGDSRALEARARAVGAPLTHTVLDGLWHDVHLSAWMIRGIGDPVGDLGRALAAQLRAGAP